MRKLIFLFAAVLFISFVYGEPCDDGDPCTYDDDNSSGICIGTAYTCNDGFDCTTDTCDGDGTCTFSPVIGHCLIDGQCWNRFQGNPNNTCQECDDRWGVYYFTHWAYDNGNSCSDGEPCTVDICSMGTCESYPYTCDDGIECTDNLCVNNGQCDYPILNGTCYIESTCYDRYDLKPEDPCLAECRDDLGYQTEWFVLDTDTDTVCDALDNCVNDSNPGQEDQDLDMIGDVCDDVDTDGDGYNWPLDCDDTNEYANPDEIEIMNDGFDNDCDGVSQNFTLYLDEGWNLIHMPIVTTSVNLSYLKTVWDFRSIFVYRHNNTFEGWLFHINDFPDEFNTLKEYHPDEPAWVDMNTAYNMSELWVLRNPQEFNVYEGWNMIGYPWYEPRYLNESFGDELDYVYGIYVYDSTYGWQSWLYDRPAELNDIDAAVPGYGAWVEVSEDRQWNFVDGIIT